MTAPRRRPIVTEPRQESAASRRRVRGALGPARSGVRHALEVSDARQTLARRVEGPAGLRPRHGHRRTRAPLNREGRSIDKKAVRRLRRQPGPKPAGPRAGPKARRPHGQDGNARHLRPSRGTDDLWSWDFIFDRTGDGRSLKRLGVIDGSTRECPVLGPRRGMTADDVREVKAELATKRGGPPQRIRGDDGPEFAAGAIRSWLAASGSGAPYVAPGSPWRDGFAESFHSRPRDEFPDREESEGVSRARALAALWKEEYNPDCMGWPLGLGSVPQSLEG